MSDNKINVNWFEIPVANLDRAAKFYSTVLDTTLVPMEMPGIRMQAFPGPENMTGALVESEHNKPAGTGTLVFLDAAGDIPAILARVGDAGGQVVLPKTPIGEFGHVGQFIDTEGNRIALHSH